MENKLLELLQLNHFGKYLDMLNVPCQVDRVQLTTHPYRHTTNPIQIKVTILDNEREIEANFIISNSRMWDQWK